LHFGTKKIDIIETVATDGRGIDQLRAAIEAQMHSMPQKEPQNLTEKAYRLILAEKMKEIDKGDLFRKIQEEMKTAEFNIYQFAYRYLAERK
jgi:putative protein kinase ArgK-like GTPase of G3E family